MDTSLGCTKRNVHTQVKRDDSELLSSKATQVSRWYQKNKEKKKQHKNKNNDNTTQVS